ncbi:pF04237 family protein [Brachyspira sp. CAG:484]|nr:pF04237 family protein [Brachyspira sp. CAG:484]
MDKKLLLKHCLVFEDAIETYPFTDKANSEYAVIRHKSNGKWFALIFHLEDILYVNLKVNPFDSAILRDEYDFITPAWHMNKSHWIKVDVSKAPIDLLDNLIKASFELTASGKARKEKTI